MKNNCLFFDRYHNNSIVVCSILIIMFLSSFVLFSLFYRFDFYVSYSGVVVKEGEFYVNVAIDSDGLQRIQSNFLVVDKRVVDFSIVKIDDDFILTDRGPMKSVYLKFDFSDDKKIVNNVLNLKFGHKSTIFSRLKELI